MKRLFFGLLIGSIVLACSSEDPAANTDAQVVDVAVGGANGDLFVPAQIRIKVGTTVRWTFMGGEHNVISGTDCAQGDDKFRSGAPQEGGTYERKFDAPGIFPYYCGPHCAMNMRGEVTVE